MLEKLVKNIILFIAKWRFKSAKLDENGRTLIFCDMGIGNFVQYLPVLRIYIRYTRCDLISTIPEIQYLIKEVLNVDSYSKIPKHKYNYVYCNFLTQTKKNILSIIRLNIPVRVGHNYENAKWARIFSQVYECDRSIKEQDINGLFLTPMVLTNFHAFTIDRNFEYIVIQPNSLTDQEKNHPNIDQVISELSIKHKIILVGTFEELQKYAYTRNIDNIFMCTDFIRACKEINSAKLYIGNDGGFGHIAYLCRTTSIIQWQKIDNFQRCSNDFAYNLIDPTAEQIIKKAHELLN